VLCCLGDLGAADIAQFRRPYPLTDTLQNMAAYIDEETMAVIKAAAHRKPFVALKLPSRFSRSTRAPRQRDIREPQLACTVDPIVDWRHLLAQGSTCDVSPSPGPTLVQHIMPCVDGRVDIAKLVCMAPLAGERWKSQVALAPIVPHARHGSKDQLLCTQRLQPLPASALGIAITAHSDPKTGQLTVRWLPGYAPDADLSGNHEFPPIGSNCSPCGKTMALLVRLLIGERMGLFIVLLSCGLSKEEINSLVELCRERHCHLVLSTAYYVHYTNALDKTLPDFSCLAFMYMQVAHLLRARPEMVGCPFAIPTVAAFEMAQVALSATSLQFPDSPPLFISGNGTQRCVTIASAPSLKAPPGTATPSDTQDAPAAQHDQMKIDDEQPVPPSPLAQRTPVVMVTAPVVQHGSLVFAASHPPRQARSPPSAASLALPPSSVSARGRDAPHTNHLNSVRWCSQAPAWVSRTLQSHVERSGAAWYRAQVGGRDCSLLFLCLGMPGSEVEAARRSQYQSLRRYVVKQQPSSKPLQRPSVSDLEGLVDLHQANVASAAAFQPTRQELKGKSTLYVFPDTQ
jgi:hypothetical protein